MASKPEVGAPSDVYRDEAAALVAAAARDRDARVVELAPRPPDSTLRVDRRDSHRLQAPPALNDNLPARPPVSAWRRVGRLVGRVLLAPLYLVVAVASIALDALFIKEFLGL